MIQDFNDENLNAFLPIAKHIYSIESVQSFYFGFYEKDGCNIIYFLEKKRRNPFVMLMHIQVNQMARF